MQKVREEQCFTESDYNAIKPKNATRIFFKQMDEGDGSYEISNKGHIRSSKGNKKILKYQYQSKSEPRVGLQNQDKNREEYLISKLMMKYHPKEVDLWRELNCL